MGDLFLFDILPKQILNLDNSDLDGIKKNEKSLEIFSIIAPCYKYSNKNEIHECLLQKIFSKLCKTEQESLIKCVNLKKEVNSRINCSKQFDLYLNCV